MISYSWGGGNCMKELLFRILQSCLLLGCFRLQNRLLSIKCPVYLWSKNWLFVVVYMKEGDCLQHGVTHSIY